MTEEAERHCRLKGSCYHPWDWRNNGRRHCSEVLGVRASAEAKTLLDYAQRHRGPWRKCDPCQRCPREQRERGRCTLVSLFQSSPSDSPGSQLPGSQKTRGPGEGSSQSRAEEGFRTGLTADGQLASSGLSAVGSTADHVDGA